jgi:lysophospholipase L1-like esterase/pimeloyl-ACP methyl ester carboxylesterase
MHATRRFFGILSSVAAVVAAAVFAILPAACVAASSGTPVPSPAGLGHAVRVACVGDSITQGAGVDHPEIRGWPARLQLYLGDKARYEVRNFGVSARTMQKAGDYPYWNEKAFADAKAFAPDVVLIKLGTNDSKPQNWNPARFAADAAEMVKAFQGLPNKPRVIICLPVPVFKADQWGIRAKVVADEVIPALRRVAFDTGADLLDFHHPFLGRGSLFPDTVHPDAYGADELAKLAFRHLAMPADPAFNIVPKLPAGAKRSEWFGYECYEFQVAGHAAKVIRPKLANARRAWAWRAEFFGHEPQADLALLENGFHLAYIDTFGLNGSPKAMAVWEAFYDLLTKAGLDKRSAMIGMSRGGLYSYNWAVLHPDRIACIYGDNPVLDIRSWPGGTGKGKGDAGVWKQTLEQYGLTAETAAKWKGGPLDNLQPLAVAKIPLLHIIGDADQTVPPAENTAILEERWRRLGGEISVIHKPGCDHHPHSLPNPEPITAFILRAHGLWTNFAAVPAPSQEWRNGSAGWGKQSWNDQLVNMRRAADAAPYDIALLGDSITQGWPGSNDRRLRLGSYDAVNMGISGDRTQNLLWRIENGLFDGKHKPKLVVVMIGINNLNNGESPEDTAAGALAVLAAVQKRLPGTTVLFFACFPGGREPQGATRQGVDRYHELIAAAKLKAPVRYVDLRAEFLNPDGTQRPDRMRGDGIHLVPGGYQPWTEAILKQLGGK